MRVLVVDDSKTMRNIVKGVLTGGATHRNEPVKSEQERLEEARRHVSQARELLDGGVIVDVE